MDTKTDLSNWFYLLNNNNLCFKRVKRILKKEKWSPQFNRVLAALRTPTSRPWNYTQLLSGTPRMYGQARGLEMHKCITQLMKGIWGGFCNPSYCFMFIPANFWVDINRIVVGSRKGKGDYGVSVKILHQVQSQWSCVLCALAWDRMIVGIAKAPDKTSEMSL